MVPYMRLLSSNFCIYVFMLLFLFSIFHIFFIFHISIKMFNLLLIFLDLCHTSCTPTNYLLASNRRAIIVNLDCHRSGPGCSKLTTSLVNVSLKFKMLISEICQYFLLKKCEKLLQCKSFSHFFNSVFWL